MLLSFGCLGTLDTGLHPTPEARRIESRMNQRWVKHQVFSSCLLALLLPHLGLGGQAPYSRAADVPVSSGDRVYLADQLTNSVSVVDPAAGMLVGVIRLGLPLANALKPVYKGQLLVHGLGYSPDSKTLVAVCVGSNGLVFIDTASNLVKHVTYVGRAPHEAMYTPDGKEVWVTIRGQDFIQVVDAETYEPKDKIKVPEGPGMVVFSPDGQYAYVCSSFTAMTVVVDTATRKVVAHVPQASAFCPNIAASPDGKQVWMTLKDTGRVQIFSATPPFANLSLLSTGPITNHVNFAVHDGQQLAYVTVGGTNQVKVFSTTNLTAPELLAEVAVGDLPHGLWPSGDGSRMFVGLENGNAVQAIDTSTHKVVATVAIGGQSPQAMVYVPSAVPADRANNTTNGNLTKATDADGFRRLRLVAAGNSSHGLGSVVVNRQGPIDALMAATTGLQPGHWYALALAPHADGSSSASSPLQPLASFKAMADGAALVSSLGPFRALLFGDAKAAYVVVVAQDGEGGRLTDVVQVEAAPLTTDDGTGGASRRHVRRRRALRG